MTAADRKLLLDRLWIPYAMLVAGFAVHLIRYSATERMRDLFQDDWVQLAVRISEPFPDYLFASHNGHLIPATRLILHADYLALGGKGALPFGFSLVFLATSIAMLLVLLRGNAWVGSPLRWTLSGFLCFCLLWASGYYGLFWGFSVHSPMTVTAFLAAVLSLIAFANQRESKRNPSLLVLAAVAAFVATLSCAAGAAAWGSLILVALAARLPIRVTASLLLAAALSVATLAFPPATGASAFDLARFRLSHPLPLPGFTLSFLGGPVGDLLNAALGPSRRLRDTASLWAGGLGLLAAAAYAIRQLRRLEGPSRLDLLAIAFMTFGVGAALVTAIARAGLSSGNDFRYTPWATQFWMGGAAALVSITERRRLAWLRLALLTALPCLTVAMLPALERHRNGPQSKMRNLAERNSLILLVGIRSDSFLGPMLHGRHETVRATLPTLERDGRGPFSDPRRSLLGQRIADLGPIADTTRCGGVVLRTIPFVDEAGVTARIEGTVFHLDSPHPPRFIVIMNHAGEVRGLGNVVPRDDQRSAAWYAYLAPDVAQRYTAFSALKDGSFCRLGELRVSLKPATGASSGDNAKAERLETP